LLDYSPNGKVLRAWQNPQVVGVGRDGKERVQTTLHERDCESGWDYRGARFYDADYGRFLSVDPLAGSFAGWSPYNYVLGNPVSLTDLTGMAPDGVEGEDPWWIRNARAAHRLTGGTLTRESATSYRLIFVYEGIKYQEVFEEGSKYDQDYFAPPPALGLDTRVWGW
jgi:RHS repeat-associated protein